MYAERPISEPSESTLTAPMRSRSSPSPVRSPKSSPNGWPSSGSARATVAPVGSTGCSVVRYGITVARTASRPRSRASW